MIVQDQDKRIEKLDRIFELTLLLVSIICATLFQLISAMPYSSEQVQTFERILTSSIRLLLFPIVLTVAMWIPAQLARRQTPKVLLLKTLAWTYLLAMLCVYLLWTMLLSFATLTWILPYLLGGIGFPIIIASILLRFVTTEYEKAMNWKIFKQRKWRSFRVLTIIIAVVLAEISILASYLI